MKSFLPVVIIMVCLTGCAGNTAVAQDAITITGQVTYVDLEGGFYGIVADDGRHFDPMNLPADMQVDGLAITATLEPQTEVLSFRMWGKIVNVIEITPQD